MFSFINLLALKLEAVEAAAYNKDYNDYDYPPAIAAVLAKRRKSPIKWSFSILLV